MKKAFKIILPLFIIAASFAGGFFMGKKHHRPHRGEPFSERPMNRMKSKMVKKLDLSIEQQAQLDLIFDKKREELKVLRQEFKPKLREQRKNLNQNVMNILEPEQKKVFQEIQRKRKKRAQKRKRARAEKLRLKQSHP